MAALLQGLGGKVAKTAVTLGTAGWLLQHAMFNVDAGHRALIFDRLNGLRQSVKAEGTHLLVPGLQFPIVYDVRTRPRVINTRTSTQDLQEVALVLRLLSRPDPEHLGTLWQQYGQDYEERILPSICNEILKSVVAQYNADQLLTLREKVSNEIRESLADRASKYNIILDDVSLTHLAFSREFAQAIEKKQVAQQDAERSKFIVAKSEQEKLAAIIAAEGEAQAAELISSALADVGPGMIQLRRIEAAVDVASVLAKARNVTYLPAHGGNMLLNLGS